MKRIVAIILILCSLFWMSVAADAEDGAENASSAKPTETCAFVTFSIDNCNVYEGMDKSYQEGYIPRVSGGYAAIVIALTCDGELDQNRLCAAVNLGDYTNMPFVCKNYEKTVWPSSESLYIVSFSIELKQDRTNGNYPVSVDITVTDKMGNQVQKTITVLPLLTTEMTRYLRMGRMKKAYLPQRSSFSHMNVRPFQTVARRTLLKPATG